MRFDLITLFPELFEPFLKAGVTRRAYESHQVDVRLWNPRDFADGNYRRVDDRPFGGGPGMVMLAEPLHQCLGSQRRGSQHREHRANRHPLIHQQIRQQIHLGQTRFPRRPRRSIRETLPTIFLQSVRARKRQRTSRRTCPRHR